ncbi:MAG: hypothetical protein ACFFCS_02655 [Candidatus Hodarchaeota archaeon]
MGDTTTIPISKETRDQLKASGQKGDTYDEIIRKLIEISEKVELFNKQKRILEEEEFVSFEKV